MSASPARTPLYEWHVAHGGYLVEFGGWSMPLRYKSIVDEHLATRTRVGMFDISHMGRLRFDGPGAANFLDRLTTRRMDDLKPGRVRYSLLTNDAGGVLDDVLVYHLRDAAGGSYRLMVVNASNREKIVRWISPRLRETSDVHFTDATHDWAMIAVQGPGALDLLAPFVEVDLPAMKYYTAVEAAIAGHGGIVSRTGYTGEDGCELIVGAAVVEPLWQSLLDAGAASGDERQRALAAGLGCRDTLRLEAAMPLYGHELGEEIDPFQAGLDFAVNLENRTFPGRDALARLRDEPNRLERVGLEMAGKRAAREGYEIFVGEEAVGRVTSGTFSPTLQRPIAMGYVRPEFAAPGVELLIDLRGRREPAHITSLPFYRRGND